MPFSALWTHICFVFRHFIFDYIIFCRLLILKRMFRFPRPMFPRPVSSWVGLPDAVVTTPWFQHMYI